MSDSWGYHTVVRRHKGSSISIDFKSTSMFKGSPPHHPSYTLWRRNLAGCDEILSATEWSQKVDTWIDVSAVRRGDAFLVGETRLHLPNLKWTESRVQSRWPGTYRSGGVTRPYITGVAPAEPSVHVTTTCRCVHCLPLISPWLIIGPNINYGGVTSNLWRYRLCFHPIRRWKWFVVCWCSCSFLGR